MSNPSQPPSTAWLIIPIAALTFAVSGPATKIAVETTDIFSVVAWRCAIAAVVLLLFVRRHILDTWRELNRRQRRLLVIAGVTLAVHFSCFVAGVRYTSYVSAMTLIALEPVVVLLSGIFFFSIRPSKLQTSGVALAIVGGLVLGSGGIDANATNGHTIGGDLLLLAAVLLWGVYYSLNRALNIESLAMRRSANLVSFSLAAIIYSIATIIVMLGKVPTLFSPAVNWQLPDPRTLTALFVLGIVPTLVGHTLSQIATRNLHPAWVAMLSPGESLGAIILGMMLFSSQPTRHEWLGGSIILLGAIFVAIKNFSLEAKAVKNRNAQR